MDRSMQRAECEFCYTKKYLDSLVRLEVVSADGHTVVFNERVCHSCKDFIVEFYWRISPQSSRYYHPA